MIFTMSPKYQWRELTLAGAKVDQGESSGRDFIIKFRVIRSTMDPFSRRVIQQEGKRCRSLLESPDGEQYKYTLRFNFQASNKEEEYEALIAGLKVAREIWISKFFILNDSQLGVKQVTVKYHAKERG